MTERSQGGHGQDMRCDASIPFVAVPCRAFSSHSYSYQSSRLSVLNLSSQLSIPRLDECVRAKSLTHARRVEEHSRGERRDTPRCIADSSTRSTRSIRTDNDTQLLKTPGASLRRYHLTQASPNAIFRHEPQVSTRSSLIHRILISHFLTTSRHVAAHHNTPTSIKYFPN